MDNELDCILLRGPKGLACIPHINAELEVIHVTEGTVEVTVGDTTLSVPRGSAVLILPYQPHCFRPLEDATGRVYMFRFRIASEFYNSSCAAGTAPFILKLSPTLDAWLRDSVKLAEAHPDETTAKALYYPIIAEYLEQADTSAAHSPHTLLVHRIMDYILNHLQDKITLKTLSAQFGINPASLSKLIKDYTYASFTDFVNNIRIEKAIELFCEQDLSVTEAASHAGFGSVRNFNRVFQDTLGITPSEYRRTKQ